MKDAILFDLDGTLWDSVQGVVQAWNQVFDRYPKIGARITPDALRGYMGKTAPQIARLMMPDATPEDALRVMDACSRQELIHLRAIGGGRLYGALMPTLDVLSARYDLFIVSNCDSGYIETFLEVHGTQRFFRGHLCPGDTGLDKAGNIARLLDGAGHPRAFYLGDTDGDERAARKAGIPFVYASYGFGRALAPDAVLDRFCDLPQLAQRLFSQMAQ